MQPQPHESRQRLLRLVVQQPARLKVAVGRLISFGHRFVCCDIIRASLPEVPSIMAARQFIDDVSLAKWLTAELKKQPGCGGCSIPSVYKLERPDPEGFNWSYAVAIGQDATSEVLEAALAVVLPIARQRFNLF